MMAVTVAILAAILVGVIAIVVLSLFVAPWLVWACLAFGLLAVLVGPRRRRARQRRLQRLGIDRWQDVWWTTPTPESANPPQAPPAPPSVPPAPESPPDPLARLPLGAR